MTSDKSKITQFAGQLRWEQCRWKVKMVYDNQHAAETLFLSLILFDYLIVWTVNQSDSDGIQSSPTEGEHIYYQCYDQIFWHSHECRSTQLILTASRRGKEHDKYTIYIHWTRLSQQPPCAYSFVSGCIQKIPWPKCKGMPLQRKEDLRTCFTLNTFWSPYLIFFERFQTYIIQLLIIGRADCVAAL